MMVTGEVLSTQHHQLPGGTPGAGLESQSPTLGLHPAVTQHKDAGGAITTEFLFTLHCLAQLPEWSLSGPKYQLYTLYARIVSVIEQLLNTC